MPQARDEAGNIWEIDAQGNPVRLVQPASQGGPIAPPNPMNAPQLEGANLNNSGQAISNTIAQGTAPTTIQTNQAPAGFMWVNPNNPREGVVPIPGYVPPGDQPKAVEPLKLSQFRALEQQLERVEQLYRAGPGSTQGIGALQDYLPTDINAAFDSAGAGLSEVGLAAFRVPGVGAQSDNELRQFVLANTPKASDRDSAIREKLRNLRTRLAATKKELGINPEVPADQQSAMDVLRMGGGTETQASERQDVGSGGMTAENYPPEMVRAHDEMVANLVMQGGGRLDPQAYASERESLFREFNYAPGPREDNEGWAAGVNEYLDSGGRTIPSGIIPAERLMSATETMRNNLVNNPVGGTIAGASNALALGAGEAIAPEQMNALRDAQGPAVMAGEIAGTIGGTMALGGAGRMAASRIAPQLLQGGGRGQFARNIATDATYGAGYGGVSQGDPLTGAALATGGSVAGQGVARGIGAAVGGAQISEAAQRLKDAGVPISVGRQIGLGRAEDAMQSIPIVGDMSRARQLDSFQGLQMAAMREGGQPIGFNPSRAGREGLEDFGQARSQFYDNTLSGVDVPLDGTFAQDMASVGQLAQNLSPANRRKLGETLNDAMQMPAAAGNITGAQYQDALVALKRLRNNPGEAMPNAARTLQDSATQSIGALDGLITRGAGPEVVEGLGRANQANRSFKTLENAMNRAAGGSQTGEIFLPTPFQMQQAGLATQKKYPGPRPFAQLADDGQQVLPSTLPNSGTTDRAIMTGILGTAGIGAGLGGGSGFAGGGDEAGMNAASGAQSGAITGASLAAALALLGTRGGQSALEAALITRPQALQNAGQAIRRRGGLFGSAGNSLAQQTGY